MDNIPIQNYGQTKSSYNPQSRDLKSGYRMVWINMNGPISESEEDTATAQLVNHPQFIKDAEKSRKSLLKTRKGYVNITKKYSDLIEE